MTLGDYAERWKVASGKNSRFRYWVQIHARIKDALLP